MFSKEFLNGELSVNELYDLQSEIWNQNNIELFGLSSNFSSSPFMINNNIKSDQDKYWNNGTCLLKEKLLDEELTFFKDRDYLIKDTWDLSYNTLNNFIKLSALFIYEVKKDNKKLTKKEAAEFVAILNELPTKKLHEICDLGEYQEYKFVVSKLPLAYLPLVTTLGYKFKNSDYSLRIQAVRNTFILRKVDGVVKQKGWEYSDGKFKDGINHFKDVNEINYPLLNAILGEQVTEDNFTKALDLMPEYNSKSLLYFSYNWFDEVKGAVLYPKRKTINAEKGKVINYINLLNAPTNSYVQQSATDKELYTNLVIVKNKIKALEVSRNVVYAPTSYTRGFTFDDAERVFDAFKVTTNGAAGRSRILLDNFYVEDGMLKITYEGKTYNHYDVILGNVPDKIKECSNLSCLSRAPYNYLNDAKRIMFCAKLRSQSVRVKGQVDDLTHEVPARVVFADWKGFNFGDSFVISESFAKKLEREDYRIFPMSSKDLKQYEVDQPLTEEELVEIDNKNKFSSWRDIRIDEVTHDHIKVVARAPFGVGDKITNLHGSKGIVSLILPDDQMPVLQNDLSPLMKKGPVDIIVPGISVYRRKSTGQVFEALTKALQLKEMSLKDLYSNYEKEIKEFDKNSVFVMQGKEFKAPCGINNFLRLDHDACSKQSFAYVKSNPEFNLHIAEMELLNLSSRGKYNILNEVDIRSLNKHTNSFSKIKKMQTQGTCENERMNMPDLKNYMKYLGWDISFGDLPTSDEIDARWSDLFEIVNNKEIDIFSEE